MKAHPPTTEERSAPPARSTWSRLTDLVAALVIFVLMLLGGAATGWVTIEAAVILIALAMCALSMWYGISQGTGEAEIIVEDNPDEVRRLRRYSVLMDSLPQPVLLLDEDDRVEVANASAERVFGEAIEGQHIAHLVRAPNALGVLREARHDGEAHEAEFTLPAPRDISALFYVAPLEGDHRGQAQEMVVMIRDRTEQRKLERMRTDFIANASHELRTPLASILGFIETLQGHARDDPAAREKFLRVMQAQTERMLRLVKDLVSLSALELNERRLPQQEVDLAETTRTVREMLEPVVEKAGGTLAPAAGLEEASILGDRDQLIQVLQNLVDNALKYGGAGGDGPPRVHISVGSGPKPAFQGADISGDSPEQIAVRAGCAPEDLLYLRVRDEGEGIEKTDLPRLTERFYRIDVERSRAKGGTGLGLAIVKHIVSRHRGGILVESAPGTGAAFTCYFPPKETAEVDNPAQSN